MTDPDDGLSTGMLVLGMIVCILAVAFAHISRKALLDYSEADMRRLFDKAKDSSIGSGLALIALSIILSSLLLLFGSKVHAKSTNANDIVPVNAKIFIPLLKSEQKLFWPDHPKPELLAGLIEQESCYRIKDLNCWSPKVNFKTSREEGAGLGQITRTFRKDGTLRFDTLDALRGKHQELKDLSWDNVYNNPQLQLRALVLLSRDNFLSLNKVIKNSYEALIFSDAAYNSGLGNVQADRRACYLTSNCDSQIWFDNVEKTCTLSKSLLYGKNSACDINRKHVENVVLVRSNKYKSMMVD
jgi:hypothetical protein